MATWMTHLRVADALLDAPGGIPDEKAFLCGSIAPDCGAPSADGFTYEPSKAVSHFGESDERDYAAFLRRYPPARGR